MSKKMWRMCALVVCGMFTPMHAFIYQVQVLRKKLPDGSWQYVVGCSDYHDKSNKTGVEQRAYIERSLKSCNAKKVKVIVEDLSSIDAKRATCGKFIVNSRGGVLGGLAHVCRDQHIAVDNIEYRYCRVASLGPIINNIRINPHLFLSSKSLEVNTIYNEVITSLDVINQYDDGVRLNKWYKSQAHQARQHMDRLHITQHKEWDIARYVNKYSRDGNRLHLLTDLLTFDSALLDVKLVHSVLNAEGKNTVLAVAGGTHIARAWDMLKKMGYQQIHTSNITAWREYNTKRCLGARIVGGKFCVKPQAVDINVIAKYMH